MTDSKPKCGKTYKTAFAALFSPEGKALKGREDVECKRCEDCKGWHMRICPPEDLPQHP